MSRFCGCNDGECQAHGQARIAELEAEIKVLEEQKENQLRFDDELCLRNVELESQVAALTGAMDKLTDAVEHDGELLNQVYPEYEAAAKVLDSTADAAKAWEEKVKREAYEEAAKVAEEYPALPSVDLEKRRIAFLLRALGEKP